MFTSGGVPCDLSHNALIYCYRTPQCIMGKIHMGPPPPPIVEQTDRQTRVKTLPSRTTWGVVINVLLSRSSGVRYQSEAS